MRSEERGESGAEVDEGLEVVFCTVRMCLAGSLMLKKKLLPVFIELVVISNHLRAINLCCCPAATTLTSAKMNNRSFI